MKLNSSTNVQSGRPPKIRLINRVRYSLAAISICVSGYVAFIAAAIIFQGPQATLPGFENTLISTSNKNSTTQFDSHQPIDIPTPADEIARKQTGEANQKAEIQVTARPSGEAILTSDHVIEAFNCARSQRRLPRYLRDSNLDSQANEILQRVIANPDRPLMDHEQGFTLTGQIVLDAGYPKLSECMVGGFDVGRVHMLEKSARIGIAVAPIDAYSQALFLVIVVGY